MATGSKRVVSSFNPLISWLHLSSHSSLDLQFQLRAEEFNYFLIIQYFLPQVELITGQAMKAGFTGGLVVDYPNSTRAKK